MDQRLQNVSREKDVHWEGVLQKRYLFKLLFSTLIYLKM